MLVYYDESGQRQPLLSYSDLHIKHVLDGEDEMSFILPTNAPEYKHIGEETQIDTEDNEWLIKKIDDDKIDCQLNFDFLKTRAYKSVLEETKPLSYILEKYLPDGWNVHGANIIGISRTTELDCVTDYDVIYSCMKTYSCYFVWKIKDRTLHVFSQEPEGLPNSGEYITKNLNLKELRFKGESTDFATRIFAYGADGLTLEDAVVNGQRYGLTYIDNNAYANKLVSYVWSDERYTTADTLYEAALKKLAEKSYPVRSYQCSVIDLAKQNEKFSYLQFKMHYKAILLDEDRGTRVEYKVVEYDEYPDEPARNKITLSETGGSIRSYVNKVVTGLEEEIDSAGSSLNQKVLLATAYLLSAFGTYQYTDKTTGNVYLLDNEDPALAESVWLFNKNGIGHSSTGINGPFTSAWTANDELVMSIVNAMVIRGEYIEAGSIKAEKISQEYTDGVVSQAVEIADGHITAQIADSVSGLQTQIEVNASGINTLTQKVDTLKIGSRNLLIDSACFATRDYQPVNSNIDSPELNDGEYSLPSEKSISFSITGTQDNKKTGIYFHGSGSKKPLNPAVVKPDTDYVLSFYAKLGESPSKTIELDKDNIVRFKNGSNLNSKTEISSSEMTLTGDWKRYVYVFKTNSSVATYAEFRFQTKLNKDDNITLFLSSLQLEEGNIVTDWHKSDGDLASEFLKPNEFSTLLDSSIGSYLTEYVKSSEINTLKSTYDTKFTQTEQAISLKADQSTVTTLSNTVDGHTTLIAQNSAAIETKANQILSTVSETYYLKSSAATLKSDLEDYAEDKADLAEANAKSYIDQQASSIKLAVESEIEVGATNLLFDSARFESVTPIQYNTTSFESTNPTKEDDVSKKCPSKVYKYIQFAANKEGDYATYHSGFKLVHDETNGSKLLACNLSELEASTETDKHYYIFSFYARQTANVVYDKAYLLHFTYDDNGTQKSMYANIVDVNGDENGSIALSPSLKRFVVRFTIPHTPTSFEIDFYTKDKSKNTYAICLSSFKLERGTVATDWALSNQDVSASLELCIKADETGKLVSAIKMAANQIEIDTNNFKLVNGSITATAGSIGGWAINPKCIATEYTLSNTTYTVYLQAPGGNGNAYVSEGDNLALGSQVIGIRSSSNYIFGVSPTGKVRANDYILTNKGFKCASDYSGTGQCFSVDISDSAYVMRVYASGNQYAGYFVGTTRFYGDIEIGTEKRSLLGLINTLRGYHNLSNIS